MFDLEEKKDETHRLQRNTSLQFIKAVVLSTSLLHERKYLAHPGSHKKLYVISFEFRAEEQRSSLTKVGKWIAAAALLLLPQELTYGFCLLPPADVIQDCLLP